MNAYRKTMLTAEEASTLGREVPHDCSESALTPTARCARRRVALSGRGPAGPGGDRNLDPEEPVRAVPGQLPQPVYQDPVGDEPPQQGYPGHRTLVGRDRRKATYGHGDHGKPPTQ